VIVPHVELKVQRSTENDTDKVADKQCFQNVMRTHLFPIIVQYEQLRKGLKQPTGRFAPIFDSEQYEHHEVRDEEHNGKTGAQKDLLRKELPVHCPDIEELAAKIE